MKRWKSGLAILCIAFAGIPLLLFDFFFDNPAYIWFLKGYILLVNVQLLWFFVRRRLFFRSDDN
jgi:hypothetical protein